MSGHLYIPTAHAAKPAAPPADLQEARRRLVAGARQAGALLPDLPAFSELPTYRRERLFRDLGYTFWNRELLDSLAERLDAEGMPFWLEIAAGTGRWAAELARRGLGVAATDDYSQEPQRIRSYQRAIEYGTWVARLPAREALAALRPGGVLCSWPPLGFGLIPGVFAGVPGGEDLRVVICVGEPGGASELGVRAHELPQGWVAERWPDCEQFLAAFNDPPFEPGSRSHVQLVIYRRLRE